MPRQARRTVLRTLGATAAAVAVLGTASGTTSLEKDLATVRKASAKYRNPRAVMCDGFTPGGPYVPEWG